MDRTDEFSFVLRPATHGVGVFAMHDIKAGAFLRVFGEKNPLRRIKRQEVPELFRNFCASRGDTMLCPPDFGYMPIGWYLNHSFAPNAVHDPKEIGAHGRWLAARDISEGEEITINYNELDEPDIHKDDYYRH